MSISQILITVFDALGGQRLVRADQSSVDNSVAFHTAVEVGGASVSTSNPLPVSQSGSTGLDYSSNHVALPAAIGATVGTSTLGGSGPFSAYVLIATVPANPTRVNIDIENVTGAQIVVVRDDGTAATGSPPLNASWFLLAGGSGSPSQGGSWSSTTFKGRIQIWASVVPTYSPTVMVD